MFCGTCKTFTIKAITSTDHHHPTSTQPLYTFLSSSSSSSSKYGFQHYHHHHSSSPLLLLTHSLLLFLLCEKRKKERKEKTQFIVEETSSSGKSTTMGRGKIEIKRIENSTNRQVTYSKRRAGIMKKARELTVLCDAEVSLIMFSSTGKFSEYISPSATTKRMFDRYQQVSGVSLWNSHYERMQENLNKQKDINNKLRREIRQRMGEDLDDLSIEELRGLEQNMDSSLKIVRDRKYHVITTQTETYRKKLRNLHETHNNLLREFEGRDEDPHYALANEGDYETALEMANGGGNIFAFRLQPSQPNLHDGGGYGSHDLRLA